jgi:hypothetical protein
MNVRDRSAAFERVEQILAIDPPTQHTPGRTFLKRQAGLEAVEDDSASPC